MASLASVQLHPATVIIDVRGCVRVGDGSTAEQDIQIVSSRVIGRLEQQWRKWN